ncbi:hypothetical protein DV707_00695 [Halobellus limi]|uniref:Uncharacterized protein n=1 Tax=Halobellus limi TaxID=699433 RepID=A0A4D6GXB6_9EURY|nr:hypothetical protein DV707_00695 [Halobellus limi]
MSQPPEIVRLYRRDGCRDPGAASAGGSDAPDTASDGHGRYDIEGHGRYDIEGHGRYDIEGQADTMIQGHGRRCEHRTDRGPAAAGSLPAARIDAHRREPSAKPSENLQRVQEV